MTNRIELLCAGRIRKEGGMVLEAHSSSTLILSDGLNIVVDTGSRELRGAIVDSLGRIGIEPEEVGIVVNTHLHHDHCANNDLFREAELMAHAAEGPGRGYRRVEEGTEISPGVRIVHTPGHSRGSISVFVEAELRYAVCGDALPTRDNYLKWVPPGLNYDSSLALESMKRIVEFADFVVPGHDAPFRIDR